MKKLLVYVVAVTFLISCGESDNTNNKGNNPSVKNDTIKEKEPSSNNSNNNEKEKITGGLCNKPISDNGSSPEPYPNC